MLARLAIGRVRTSFGRDGAVKIESYSGETDHFLSLSEITLVKGARERVCAVEEVRVVGHTVVARLEGIATPESARELRGWDVVVPRKDAARLAHGEYYTADLHGLEVRVAGRRVGTVEAVWDAGGRTLLEVVMNGGESRLVPFEDAFVGSVDPAKGRMELTSDMVLE